MAKQNNDWIKHGNDGEKYETWDMDKEKEIQGIYIQKNDYPTTNNPMYVIQKEDGKKIGVWGSAVLDREFEKVTIGTEVKIIFIEKISLEGGKTLKKFDFFSRPNPKGEIDSF